MPCRYGRGRGTFLSHHLACPVVGDSADRHLSLGPPEKNVWYEKVMEIRFDVDGVPATFTRNAVTGRSILRVGDESFPVQSPWQLSTHFTFRTRTAWRLRVRDHDIEIVKVRPRVFGGARPNSVTVWLDGDLAAEATGM